MSEAWCHDSRGVVQGGPNTHTHTHTHTHIHTLLGGASTAGWTSPRGANLSYIPACFIGVEIIMRTWKKQYCTGQYPLLQGRNAGQTSRAGLSARKWQTMWRNGGTWSFCSNWQECNWAHAWAQACSIHEIKKNKLTIHHYKAHRMQITATIANNQRGTARQELKACILSKSSSMYVSVDMENSGFNTESTS